jgi:hypothetical protein
MSDYLFILRISLELFKLVHVLIQAGAALFLFFFLLFFLNIQTAGLSVYAILPGSSFIGQCRDFQNYEGYPFLCFPL